MKVIMNGKKYDTDTAVLKLSLERVRRFDDFDQANIKLYQKKNGEYFWHAIEANIFAYQQNVILLVTREKAMKFLEDYITVDKFEEIFGEVEE